MNKYLYDKRCKCNEDRTLTKKSRTNNRSEGKPLQYPVSEEIRSKTFFINCQKPLSYNEKFVLNSFHNKYVYYAIDDIFYLLKSNKSECNYILSCLSSTLISIYQTNFSANFFDIWIKDIYISELSKSNKFLRRKSKIFKKSTCITIVLLYKTSIPAKRQKSLW